MGSHFTLISSKTQDLTPDLATQFSTMPASTTERDLQPKRLKMLRETITNGMAISFCWATAKVLATGEVFRVNGHHSSHVLAELNGSCPNGLKAHIDAYEVPTYQDLVVLFRQFDNRVSARSPAEVAGAYQGLYVELADTPKPAAKQAIDGAAWFLSNIRGDSIPGGDDRFDLFNKVEIHPYIQMVGRILSIKTDEFTKAVLGAMFGTFEAEPRESEVFWSAVSKQGGGHSADHPATVLDAWLITARETKEQKPSEKEVYAACVQAWNAFRHNKPLTSIAKFSKRKGAPEIE